MADAANEGSRLVNTDQHATGGLTIDVMARRTPEVGCYGYTCVPDNGFLFGCEDTLGRLYSTDARAGCADMKGYAGSPIPGPFRVPMLCI